MVDKTKNVFVSHHSADDEQIKNLRDLLARRGYYIRNSSIDSSKPNDASSEEYVKSLLRPRIEWAGTTVVLIGKDTHKRDWVDWEIEKSHREGNRIIGIYVRGAQESDVPGSLEKYGDDLVGWHTDRIISAIDGREVHWEKPDGSPWNSRWNPSRSDC